MRVGNATIFRTSYTDIMKLQKEQTRLGNEMTTGNRVNAPSDDAAYAPTIMNSRYSLEQVKQYRTNLESAQTWIKASENSMDSMVSRLTRARELAEQFATGTYSKDEYSAAAAEIKNIINDLILLANYQSNGSYIFGGTSSNSKAPANYNLVVTDPIFLTRPGHHTSSEVNTLGGNSFLRLTRTQGGQLSNIQIAAGNTLGNFGLNLNFGRDNWEVIRSADNTTGQIVQSLQSVPVGGDVSIRAGESFSWLSDQDVGWQTFRTWAALDVTGAGSVTIDTVTYNFTDAADLITQLNAAGQSGYSAVWDNATGDVRILSCGDPLDISVGGGATLDQSFTMDEVNDYINDGISASGALTLNDNSAAFPPQDTDYVRVGDIQVTWAQVKSYVGGLPANPGANDYVQALSTYFNDQTSEFNFTMVDGNNGMATLQVDALLPGKAGNVIIASNSYCATSSGSLYGGLDPQGQDVADSGHIYGSGHSNLNISTTVKGQVLSSRYDTTNGKLVSAVVGLSWVDDSGQQQYTEVELRNTGEGGRVNVPELGPDFYLYRDNLEFAPGSTFEFTLSHLQSNQEDINVNYTQDNTLRYNWTLDQVLGNNMRLDLSGVETVPRNSNAGNGLVYLSGYYSAIYGQNVTFDIVDSSSLVQGKVLVRASWIDASGQSQQKTVALDKNGGGYGAFLPMFDTWAGVALDNVPATMTQKGDPGSDGQIIMNGSYKGLTSTNFTYEITGSGQLNSDNAGNQPVTVKLSWVDDQGIAHEDEVEFTCAGEEFAVEISGSGGLSFYLEPGAYNAMPNVDIFQQKVEVTPGNTADGFFLNLEAGEYAAGDSFYADLPASGQYIIDIMEEWRLALLNEDAEAVQKWSGRALDAIKDAQANLLDCIADAGSRQIRIDGRVGVLDSQTIFHSETLIALQEADEESNLLKIQALLSTYNDSLKVTSRLTDMFILNFI